ncbi:hypothetical protein BY996DRAFT_1502579 [Phakopsora pachyrhizi]|nr:hypothetical protein BY996DRAFT_1502579 [Phakopsora pachyrhizi]
MASGVGVNPKCVEDFMTLKLGKKIKYIIYNLSNDNTEVVVSKTSDNQSYDEFLADLPSQSCCYAVYDFEFDLGEGTRNKLCFFAWLVVIVFFQHLVSDKIICIFD